MIEISNISKTYENGGKALRDINITIEDGEFVFIMGRSGSGKSTLLKLMLKEAEPTSGRIVINDMDLQKMPRRYVPKFRRKLGVVFQDFRLLQDRNVFENVAFAQRVVGASSRSIRESVPRMLKLVGLSSKYKMEPQKLSGGEQQRVAIARALMQQAKVILADEPIASLDPESARIVMDTLRDINQNDGITVVVTLHQVDYALRYCERIVALRQGHVFYDGSSQQFDNERFDHLYRSINRIEENAKAA